MLHEGLVWKISTGGASPLRGAGPWRSHSYEAHYYSVWWAEKLENIDTVCLEWDGCTECYEWNEIEYEKRS